MGKVVGRLLLVVAAIAVNFIPGVGQAISGVLLGPAAAAAAGGTAALIGTAISGTLALAGLRAAAGLLGLGPKAPPPQSTVTTVKTPIPPRVKGYGRRRMYGSKILFETNDDGTTVDVYAYHDGEIDGIEQVYLNDDKVTIVDGAVQTLPDKRYQSGLVRAGFTVGATPNTAFSEVIALLPGIWTTDHRGDGVVTGYLTKRAEKDKYIIETYPQGDAVELSAVMRLKKCFDPRTDLTVWTENPVLHTLDYLVNERGVDYDTRIAPTLDYWIEAANICDEPVLLKSGGTEPRYRGSVVYDATRAPKEILGSLLECFDGWIAPRGDGAYVIYAGKLYEPTVTLGSDEIIDFNLPYGVASEERVDQFSVSYISAESDYSVVETTPWGNPGIRTDAFSPQTPSFSQNRRLAKRNYLRVNNPNRGSITTNLGGRAARGERFINLVIEEGGVTFFSGMVEVVSVRRDFSAGGLAIDWVAVDPATDEWDAETEEGDGATAGERVPPTPADAPVILDATLVPDSANTSARLLVTASGPEGRSDLTWTVAWRVAGDLNWNESEFYDIDPIAEVSIYTETVPLNSSIEVRVSYATGDGKFSDWSATLTVDSTLEIILDGGNASGEV